MKAIIKLIKQSHKKARKTSRRHVSSDDSENSSSSSTGSSDSDSETGTPKRTIKRSKRSRSSRKKKKQRKSSKTRSISPNARKNKTSTRALQDVQKISILVDQVNQLKQEVAASKPAAEVEEGEASVIEYPWPVESFADLSTWFGRPPDAVQQDEITKFMRSTEKDSEEALEVSKIQDFLEFKSMANDNNPEDQGRKILRQLSLRPPHPYRKLLAIKAIVCRLHQIRANAKKPEAEN